MELPMREKYVDEAVGVWMAFGTYPDGRTDVCTADKDLFIQVDAKVAEKLVAQELYALLCRAPAAEEVPAVAVLGVDGNAAYALLGPNLQEGEAEFRGVADGMAPLRKRQRDACLVALSTLRHRLGQPDLAYRWADESIGGAIRG